MARSRRWKRGGGVSRSALEANRLGYEVGVRINIDVLNAQNQLADTQQAKASMTPCAQLRLSGRGRHAGTLGKRKVSI